MTFIVSFVTGRKQGLSLAQFKNHYESKHVPLLQNLTGDLFPNSHTRYYIHRTSVAEDLAGGTSGNSNHLATVLLGDQADFDHDAFAVLIFKNKSAFEALHARMSQRDAAERVVEDEDAFFGSRQDEDGDCG